MAGGNSVQLEIAYLHNFAELGAAIQTFGIPMRGDEIILFSRVGTDSPPVLFLQWNSDTFPNQWSFQSSTGVLPNAGLVNVYIRRPT